MHKLVYAQTWFGGWNKNLRRRPNFFAIIVTGCTRHTEKRKTKREEKEAVIIAVLAEG
jgi:hypothetical protein